MAELGELRLHSELSKLADVSVAVADGNGYRTEYKTAARHPAQASVSHRVTTYYGLADFSTVYPESVIAFSRSATFTFASS